MRGFLYVVKTPVYAGGSVKVSPVRKIKKLLLYNKLPVSAGNLTKGGHCYDQ